MHTLTEEQYGRRAASVRLHAERHPDRVKVQAAAKQRTYRADPANWAKVLARKAVADALRRGELTRTEACGGCAVPCKPEASHDDYTQRLLVEWLCKRCHSRKDRRVN